MNMTTETRQKFIQMCLTEALCLKNFESDTKAFEEKFSKPYQNLIHELEIIQEQGWEPSYELLKKAYDFLILTGQVKKYNYKDLLQIIDQIFMKLDLYSIKYFFDKGSADEEE